MSFRDALFEEIGRAGQDEFGERVQHIPTCRSPNGRPAADPARPAYELVALFDKNEQGARPYDAHLQPGREIAKEIASMQPFLVAPACDFAWPPNEGDEFAIGFERYRVTQVRRDMDGMTRCCLEQLGRSVPG